MGKKFEFDHTDKWYMHNSAPVLVKLVQSRVKLKENEKKDKHLDLAKVL